MFTGIISHLGKLEMVKEYRYTLSSAQSFFAKLGKGRSVSVNGICLTVIAFPNKNRFSVEVMPETLRRTNLGDLNLGDYVNLELSVSPQNLFDGHIVLGHIDGTAIITEILPEGNPIRSSASNGASSWIFRFKVKENLSKYLVEKGSVAVNGISLTVIDAGKDFFTVGIIPTTWKKTILQFSRVGDKVNIEVDILAKYIGKLLKK